MIVGPDAELVEQSIELIHKGLRPHAFKRSAGTRYLNPSLQALYLATLALEQNLNIKNIEATLQHLQACKNHLLTPTDYNNLVEKLTTLQASLSPKENKRPKFR